MTLTTSEVDALKSSLDFWFKVEYVSTVIVLLGVVGEYVAEFTRFAEDRQLTRPLGKLSTLVLIVGLAGELWGLGRTSTISEQLTAFLEERVAEAEESTKRIEGGNLKLREGIATLEKESAAARVEIAQAQARAAEANQKAEEERLARIKIEQQLANRDLSDKEFEQLVNTLRVFAGGNVNLTIAYAGEDEVAHIGDQIEQVFWRAGWKFFGSRANRTLLTIAFPEYRGVWVWPDLGAEPRTEIAAGAILSALGDVGILAVMHPNPPAPLAPYLPRIHVVIGRK